MGREIAARLGHKSDIIRHYTMLGCIQACRGDYAAAEESYRTAFSMSLELGSSSWESWALHSLAWSLLAQGHRGEAADLLRRAAMEMDVEFVELAQMILAGLDEAVDNSAELDAIVPAWKAKNNQPEDGLLFPRWRLEAGRPTVYEWEHPGQQPGECSDSLPGSPILEERFSDPLSTGWHWTNPAEDCRYSLANGLEIFAGNGRGLWRTDLTAPRLTRTVVGEGAIEVTCEPVSTGRPCLGGLLIWRDRDNFLRLDRGVEGPNEISLKGYIRGERAFLGRGRLIASGSLVLRLEWNNSRVRALCSPDGIEWFLLGTGELAGEGPVEVGMCALGEIDRMIHYGEFAEGVAIRFMRATLWQDRAAG
jgi:hypothetical protein